MFGVHGAERSPGRRDTFAWVKVTFFGTGFVPCSGDRYRRYGGNTSCLVVTIEGDDPLILDLGTGLRALGDSLDRGVRALGLPCRPRPCSPICTSTTSSGLPFFAPLHDPGHG